jgi:predicted SAM-dependent methyltransferase
MKLHVGCGSRFLPGYIHVDCDASLHAHIDVQCTLDDLRRHFQPHSVEEIYACHVLEHVSRHSISKVFDIFFSLLVPGGLLRIAVPDIEAVARLYLTQKVPLYPTLYGLIWGGQKNQWDAHTCGFDFATLSQFLVNAGFEDVARYDWRTFLPGDYDDFSKCYIPHMDVENGTLVSLNVTAHCTSPKSPLESLLLYPIETTPILY